MQITFLAESLSANSLGRTYCLWLLARSLGWKCRVLATKGAVVWGPLAGTEFADACQVIVRGGLTKAVPPGTDLLVACKPLPESLGTAIPVALERRLPLLVDIDDPDLEARLRLGRPLERIARSVRRPLRTREDLRLRRAAWSLHSLVSNPWLQARYGGTIVPHARADVGAGRTHDSVRPQLAFVGTNRPHKGVGHLRAAVGELQHLGFTLTITDTPPADARPWESWIGQTTFVQGIEVVRNADIVAIPSLRTRHSEGQLPAKLIDAMLLSRAVVVTDVDPMPWAVGDGGLTVEAGSTAHLTEALARLADPAIRLRLGDAARKRALSEFTVDALKGRFADACRAAVSSPSSLKGIVA